MAYPEIFNRKIQYDIDGTIVGYNKSSYNNAFTSGITTWMDSNTLSKFNGYTNSLSIWDDAAFWFFFPEKREIKACVINITKDAINKGVQIQGSNDTTNGMDGTWETATMLDGNVLIPEYGHYWRSSIKRVSFSTAYKTIRVRINSIYSALNIVHFYGNKTIDETSDDILFTDIDGVEFTALTDWGDRPEGTVQIKSFKVKNSSLSKTANTINLSINHTDFLLSADQTNWVTSLDIASLLPETLSDTIYIKNTIGPHPQVLGPKASRIVYTIGNWT